MSRIGNKPIQVPSGVQVKIDKGLVHIKGPKGFVERQIHSSIKVVQEGDKLLVQPAIKAEENSSKKERKEALDTRKFHGLTRSLLANMVDGAATGFTRQLTLVGVGYRAAPNGKGVTLTVGYSHPIDFTPPAGVTITVDKQTSLQITGADKELVGQVAATLRGYKPPEPYHGKGIRYADEVIQTKVGKAAGKK